MGDGFISLGESSYISEHGTEARYSATVHSALDHLVDRHSAGMYFIHSVIILMSGQHSEEWYH